MLDRRMQSFCVDGTTKRRITVRGKRQTISKVMLDRRMQSFCVDALSILSPARDGYFLITETILWFTVLKQLGFSYIFSLRK